MKRLLKNAAEEFTYTFESPIYVRVYNDYDDMDEIYDLKTNDEYADQIRNAVDDDMNEMGPTGLEQYFDYNYRKLEDGIIKSIIVSVPFNKAVTTVKTIRELSNGEIEIIKDYISGQFSDGWGEGFEQREVETWHDDDVAEEWDEEAEEYYEADIRINNYVYASFWSNKDWDIILKK